MFGIPFKENHTPTENMTAKLAWPPLAGALPKVVKNDFPIHLQTLDLTQETQKVKLTNALFYSVLKGRLQKVKFLIDQNISVNARNDHGYNPLVAALHIEKDSRRRKMFRLLLQNGGNPLARDVPNNRDVLSWACLLGRPEQVVTLLTDYGGDIHLTDTDHQGLSALHYGTHANNLAVVQSLITVFNKYNMSVDIRDAQGMTPYTHARRLGHTAMAELLKNEGNASVSHADSIDFKSPREWSQIGRFERQWDEYRTSKIELNKARIYGKLNKAKALRELKMPARPSLTSLEDEHPSQVHSDSSSDVGPSTETRNGRSESIQWSPGHAHKAKHSDRLVQSVCTFPTDKFKFKKSFSDKFNPLPLDQSFNDIDNQSLSSRISNKAALNLMAMTDKGKLVDRFHSSEFDKSKASQYQSDNVGNFLTILSDQSSPSYRQSVKVPPPRVPSPPPSKRRGKLKSNVSSLAIIMGRQKSGSKRLKKQNLSKTPESRRNKNDNDNTGRHSKKKSKSKHFTLPDIKINDRAV